jgi:hypothetical protein
MCATVATPGSVMNRETPGIWAMKREIFGCRTRNRETGAGIMIFGAAAWKNLLEDAGHIFEKPRGSVSGRSGVVV